MYLTKEEERVLDGEYGNSLSVAMKILLAIGKVFNAEKLVPIGSAHVSGVSYFNIGDAGTEFLERMVEAQAPVLASSNPGAIDAENWHAQSVDREFAEKQLKIYKLLQQMGIRSTFTCTPYLAGYAPESGSLLAWGESSAVVVGNSFYDARTNRMGGPLTVAAALVGKAPLYGLLVEENRRGTNQVKLGFKPESLTDLSTLGYHVGEVLGEGIPTFSNLILRSVDEYKFLGAALATSSGMSMFKLGGCQRLEKMSVGKEEIDAVYEKFSSSDEADAALLGCPHLSLDEMHVISDSVKGRSSRRKLLLFTSRKVHREASDRGYISLLSNSGVQVFLDTCMVVSPLEKAGFNSVMVDSCKAAHYLSSRGFDVQLKKRGDLLRWCLT